ncbi:transmembrane protein, putative, partial [Bodo saltans]
TTVAGSGAYALVNGVGTAASFLAPYGHRAYCKPQTAPMSRRQCGVLVADWLYPNSANAIRFVEIIETTATASLSPTEGLASTTATTSFSLSTTGDYTVTTSQNVSVSLETVSPSFSSSVNSATVDVSASHKSLTSSASTSKSVSVSLVASPSPSSVQTPSVTRSGGTPTLTATTACTLTMSPSLSSSLNSETANVSATLRSPTSSTSTSISTSATAVATPSASGVQTPSNSISAMVTITESNSLTTSFSVTRSGGTPTFIATNTRTLTMSPSLSSSNSATANVSATLRSPTSSSSRSTSATKSHSDGTMTIRTFPKITWTESASTTQWRCDDRARQLLVASLSNTATWWSQVAATLNDDGVVAISLSDSFKPKKINETNSSSLQFILTSTPIERVVLMNAPRIALNISLIAPPSAPALHWTVWAVSLLGGEEGVLLSYEYNKSFDASWQMLVVQPPPPEEGGWLGPDARIMQDRVVSLNVTMACGGDPRLLVVIKIPAPRYYSEFAEKVALAAQISQIISILAGGSSTSGSALGRALATKSMVICDVDSAMDDGGVLDFSINVCGEVAAPLDLESVAQTELLLATAAARSAVVTNIIVIVIVASVLLLSSVAWAFRQDVSLSHALRFVFCLPSSLLSVWTASLPSFASSFTLLAARVQSTSSLSSSVSCVVGDVLLIIAGILCSVAPAVAIITLWSKNKSNNGSLGWVCERVVVDEINHHGEQQAVKDRHTTRTCIHHPRVIMMRRWQWRTSSTSPHYQQENSTSRYDYQQEKNSHEENQHATATQPPPRHNNNSNKKKYTTEMRSALTVLQEFRLLWYPGGVDQAVLVAASSLAVVAGLDVTSRPQCVGCTAAVVGLLLGQCLCVAWHQPFTTLFSFLFALATIAATCVGVFAQLMFLVTSPTSVSGLWMVQASVICTLIVTGLSTLKMMMDLHEFALAVYRRVSLLFGCASDTRRFHMHEEVESMELPAIGLVGKEKPMVPASHSSSPVALIDALLLRDDDDDVRPAGDDDGDDWWASGRGLDLLFWDTKGAAKTETKREQGKNRLRDDVHSEDEGDGNVLSMFNRE